MKLLILATAVGSAVWTWVGAQTLERAVIASGAVRAQNGNVAIHGTIGQPIVGLGVLPTLIVGHGFWYRIFQQLSGVERIAPVRVRIEPQPVVTTARIVAECPTILQGEVLTLQGKRTVVIDFVARGAVQEAELDCTERASGLYVVRVQCGSEQLFLPLMIAK